MLEGLSPRATVLSMLLVPACMMLTYGLVLQTHRAAATRPREDETDRALLMADQEEHLSQPLSDQPEERAPQPLSTQEKIATMSGLAKYMLPLGSVYFFEYLINQGNLLSS